MVSVTAVVSCHSIAYKLSRGGEWGGVGGFELLTESNVRAMADTSLSPCLVIAVCSLTLLWFATEIMKQGGTCGIPTDTVYVLAAACSRPDAVEKAYR